MTVKELIEKLKLYDENSGVCNYHGGYKSEKYKLIKNKLK